MPIEYRFISPHKVAINPSTVEAIGRFAQPFGVAIGENIILSDIRDRAVEELLGGRLPLSPFGTTEMKSLMTARLMNELARSENDFDFPITKLRGTFVGAGDEKCRVPTSAQLIIGMHQGLRQILGSKLDGLEIFPSVLYYDDDFYDPRASSNTEYFLYPHTDFESLLLRANLALFGEADFFWSQGELVRIENPDIGETYEEFRSKPQKRRLREASLTVIREAGLEHFGDPTPHAVGRPIGESGIRIGLTIGYYKPNELG